MVQLFKYKVAYVWYLFIFFFFACSETADVIQWRTA